MTYTCPNCGRTSHNPNDERERYCGACHRYEDGVRVIDMASDPGTILLPPPPDVCQCCAAAHDLREPHNQDSLFWQYWFRREYGRWPKWADAMEHCDPHIKEAWIAELRNHGVPDEQIFVST